MRSRTIAAVLLSLAVTNGVAGADTPFATLILCGLHGDAWIDVTGSAPLSEIRIESDDGMLVPAAYESYAAKGYEPSVLLADTPFLLWDRSDSQSLPLVHRYELGFIYDSTGGAAPQGERSGDWEFYYATGGDLHEGMVIFYVPEPASLSLIGLVALALSRRNRTGLPDG